MTPLARIVVSGGLCRAVCAADTPSHREGLSVPTLPARMSSRQTAGANTSLAQTLRAQDEILISPHFQATNPSLSPGQFQTGA